MEFLPWAFAALVLVVAVVNGFLVRRDANERVNSVRADVKESIDAIGAQAEARIQAVKDETTARIQTEWERASAECHLLRESNVELSRQVTAFKIMKSARTPPVPKRMEIPSNGIGEREKLTYAEDHLD